MTREEAYDKWLNRDGDVEVSDIVDIIYDDLESRTCENCEHSVKEDKKFSPVWFCGGALKYSQVQKDFGCNKFEAKR